MTPARCAGRAAVLHGPHKVHRSRQRSKAREGRLAKLLHHRGPRLQGKQGTTHTHHTQPSKYDNSNGGGLQVDHHRDEFEIDISDEDGNEVEYTCVPGNEGGEHVVCYQPRKPGTLTITMYHDGEQIPGSPFRPVARNESGICLSSRLAPLSLSLSSRQRHECVFA